MFVIETSIIIYKDKEKKIFKLNCIDFAKIISKHGELLTISIIDEFVEFKEINSFDKIEIVANNKIVMTCSYSTILSSNFEDGKFIYEFFVIGG